MKKFIFLINEWIDFPFFCLAEDIFGACDKFKEYCKASKTEVTRVHIEEVKGIPTHIGVAEKDDYNEFLALRAGYSSYEDMKKDGISFD